jgi:HK97 family phage major capsid protein
MASSILRGNAEALIPEEISKEIIQGAIAQSAVLSLFKKLPNMSSKVQRMPVLDGLITAGFINGDTGLKSTAKAKWANKFIVAEEIAVIVPIAESVLNDALDNGYDIWGEVKPLVQQAFGAVIDNAIIFDIGKPSSWRAGILSTARNAGSIVNAGGAEKDLYDDIMGEDGVIAKVEADGYTPNGVISGVTLKSKLRGLRDTNGKPIFITDMQNGTAKYSVDGMPSFFIQNGAWNDANALAIVGDMQQAVYAIRQDITYKILTEGVIQDPDGTIAYNLAQQDMVALRCVMRLGWEMPNPVNAMNDDNATRCPFAIYSPAVPVTTQNVTFTVTDTDDAAVEGATVVMAGMTKKTAANGTAVFTAVAGNYDYIVAADGADTQTGSVTVAAQAVAVAIADFDVVEETTTYAVTFTVTDNADPAVAVEGADVVVGGKVATTNAQGVAVLQLPAGAHDYIVAMDEYVTLNGTATVVDVPLAVAVEDFTPVV